MGLTHAGRRGGWAADDYGVCVRVRWDGGSQLVAKHVSDYDVVGKRRRWCGCGHRLPERQIRCGGDLRLGLTENLPCVAQQKNFLGSAVAASWRYLLF